MSPTGSVGEIVIIIDPHEHNCFWLILRNACAVDGRKPARRVSTIYDRIAVLIGNWIEGGCLNCAFWDGRCRQREDGQQ